MAGGKPPPRGAIEIEYMARQFEGLAINLTAARVQGEIDLAEACTLIAEAIRWTIDPSDKADRGIEEVISGINSFLALAELESDDIQGLLGFADPKE